MSLVEIYDTEQLVNSTILGSTNILTHLLREMMVTHQYRNQITTRIRTALIRHTTIKSCSHGVLLTGKLMTVTFLKIQQHNSSNVDNTYRRGSRHGR